MARNFKLNFPKWIVRAKQGTDIEIVRGANQFPISEIGSLITSGALQAYGSVRLIDYGFLEILRTVRGQTDLRRRSRRHRPVKVTYNDCRPWRRIEPIGKKATICIREPSLGLLGMKGGAAGGGYACVVPMEDMFHFTGDMHAIGAAHNLLSAMIDNHLYWDNELRLDRDAYHGAGCRYQRSCASKYQVGLGDY